MLISAQIETVANVHQLALFIGALTAVYRVRALIPIYLYIMLEGLLGGFGTWWIPYLYLWLILWGMFMLIPRGLPMPVFAAVSVIISGLHGLGFGLMYAPYQCLVFFKGDFSQFWAWVAYGLPTDIAHMIGNICAALLIVPLTVLICKLDGKPIPFRQRSRSSRKSKGISESEGTRT